MQALTPDDHLRAAVAAARGDLRTAIRLLASSRTGEGRRAHQILVDRARTSQICVPPSGAADA